MKSSFSQCIVFYFLLALPCAAADYYQSVFDLAQQLEQNGAQKEAATEYKRYLFLQDFSAGLHVQESYIALARYYRVQADTPLALTYTRLARQSSAQPQEETRLQQQEIDLMLALALAENTPLHAEPVFFSYLYLDMFSPVVREYAWCAFLAYCVQTNQWELFETNLAYAEHTFTELFLPDEQTSLYDALSAYAAFKPKSPKLAGWLSLVPGLGQLYAHDFKDALNAFLLDGGLIALSVYSLVHLQFWDFSLLEFSPTLRFYRGNLYNAQKDTYAYNEKKIAAIRQPIITILQRAQARLTADE